MLEQITLPLDEKHAVHVNAFLPATKNHIFNEADYFRLHSSSAKDVYAQLVRQSDRRVFATIAFHEAEPQVFVSPRRGTFGGISLNGEVDFALLEQFLMTVGEFLRKRGAHSLRIRCAPISHDPALFASVFNILTRNGYVLDAYDLSYDLQIDARPLSERIDYGNVKRIRKAQREGFLAAKVEASRWRDVYRVIELNRARLGVAVSMSEVQLQQMLELFPERLHFFAVFRNADCEEMVASAICLALNEAVFYVFYWGDIDTMSSYSPIALLATQIYSYCQDQNFILMDAGISTLGGEPNLGLIKFKRNLGFSESLKVDFKLQLA